ncbi:MAG: TonB-dependent receptor [Gammaproteobacteria bacterium]
MNKHLLALLAGVTLGSVAGHTAAQSKAEDLGEITVTSPRVDTVTTKVPTAISVVDKDDIQLGRQQLGLDESLNRIPGVFMLNRYNFSQDLRVAIRGFGARSDFGIRGIKIIADGIPQTLPDGQGGIDAIDLASAERIEVIRGPASSLYGTASGGVINIVTEEGPEEPFVEGRYSYGSYDFQKYNLKAGGQKDKLNYLVNIGRYEIDGYRGNSQTESVLANVKFRYDIDATSDLTTIVNILDSPLAQDPGGLTLAQVQQDRRQAAPNALLFDAGESITQQQIGFVYRKEFSDRHEIRLRNYYVWRDFENKLPIGIGGFLNIPRGQVAFQRFFVGGGGQYTYNGDRNRLTVGFDIENQDDDRQNFINFAGGRQGPLSLNQNENVSSLGFFAQNEFFVTDKLTLTTGIRYDEVEFDVTDKFFADGNQSGTVKFDEVSPMVGLLYSPIQEVNLYGNVSTSFETPSTTEFGNPAGVGGFNQNLDALTATNYEIGVKGVVPQWWALSYDAAIFMIDGENELVPQDIDQNFFITAGETERKGFELALSANPLPGLTTSFSYTYSDFEYKSFQPIINNNQLNFNGNNLPGIPEHFGFFEVAYNHPSGFYGVWDTLLVGSLFAENANAVEVAGYGVSNIRFGYTKNIGNVEISPFVGINNVFDKQYFSNIRINDNFQRFFEPGPELNAYAGLSARYNF